MSQEEIIRNIFTIEKGFKVTYVKFAKSDYYLIIKGAVSIHIEIEDCLSHIAVVKCYHQGEFQFNQPYHEDVQFFKDAMKDVEKKIRVYDNT